MLKQSENKSKNAVKSFKYFILLKEDLPVTRETRKAQDQTSVADSKETYAERGQSGLVCQEARGRLQVPY